MHSATQELPETVPQAISLVPGIIDIGRAAENHIVVDEPDISQYHARIITYFHESFLIDLSSEHGTYLNGERVVKHSIKDGDVIQVGEHLFVVKSPQDWFLAAKQGQ